MRDENAAKCRSLGDDALQKLAERPAQCLDLGEVVGEEIGAGSRGIGPFAGDLNNADHLSLRANGRADDFLNGFGGVTGDFYAFKYGGVARDGEIVLDVRAIVTGGASGQR